MFKKIQEALALARLNEESLYKEASDEIRNGVMREGLWAKSIAESNGDESAAKAIYIRLRVQAIKDDRTLLNAAAELAKLNETELLERQAREEEALAAEFRLQERRRAADEEDRILAEAKARLEDAGYMVRRQHQQLWEVWKTGEIFPSIMKIKSISELRRFSEKVAKSVRR